MEEKGIMDSAELISNISALPEDCISHILSFTSPRDACRCAAVSSKFRSAATSDSVWQRFLPSGWEHTASSLTFASKKDLFFRLSNGFALEKWNDKIWCMLGPGELSITWHDYPIDDEQFLGYLPDYEPLTSRFTETPHIKKTTGMSVKGRINLRILSPYTHYVAYFVYVPRFYIFDYHEVRVSVKFISEGVEEELTNYIVDKEVYGHPPLEGFGYVHPRKRDDGWTEVEMGEFFTGDDHQDDEVEVRLWETDRYGASSNGLFLQGIEFRPKEIA